MDKDEEETKSAIESGCSKESSTTKSKQKSRGKKRKRSTSESSSDYEDGLPDNALQVEKSITASAIKNNLDDIGVRKILKKVVTNDHVLALVKLREEEEEKMGPKENSLQPKLTRAKVKELMKVSPKTAPWNLENLELTPIKHIPVKTRPEVKALIAQELPEDEDDEEYEPTHDDVPSDDDQGLESCSDLDSQPRTPATPRSQHTDSPRVVKDGPFKVPQDISTPSRRKLDLEEEATIALRTRSKLSLSATSIEHIESTFVPPDDIPMPAVDDLWNQFLNECLNPASTSKHEDDDETDPEYNVAADPDAHDEDEEALSNSIIKISKKELNDLVTELFNIMPEAGTDDGLIADNLANSVLTDNSQTELTRWEGKQEPISDDEGTDRRSQSLSDKIMFEKTRVSVGKTEPPDIEEEMEVIQEEREVRNAPVPQIKIKPAAKKNKPKQMPERSKSVSPVVRVSFEEQEAAKAALSRAPPLLQKHLKPPVQTCEYVHIHVDSTHAMLPEQIKILQQQLRQHIQIATSNFLQLYIHPIHWSFAPQYKEYLTTFKKLAESNPNSVVNVCNLKPAVELITTWEKSLSANTPENSAIVQFIQNEIDKSLRRGSNKAIYLGEFHETFLKVVANSSVFLYPYLLPPTPYRGDCPRKYSYTRSEDELIVLGLDQFFEYVRNNPAIYKPDTRKDAQSVRGLKSTIQLVIKHMFPWMSFKMIFSHIRNARKTADNDNPIRQYFRTHEVKPVKHMLLPYNPQLTLYEHPEEEVPRIYVRYLAKTSQRFRSYLRQRKENTGRAPTGVLVQLGQVITEPSKTAQPMGFIKPTEKQNLNKDTEETVQSENQLQNNQLPPQIVTNLFRFVETSTGAYLVPLTPLTTTIGSNTAPITSHIATTSNIIANNLPENTQTAKVIKPNPKDSPDHCTCCILLRKICKVRQTLISEFWGSKKPNRCYCKINKYPRVSNKLKLLVNNYKSDYVCLTEMMKEKLEKLEKNEKNRLVESDYNADDLAHVTKFHLKLLTRSAISNYHYTKRRVHSLLSKFDIHKSDPLKLASELSKTFATDLVDLYKDFLVFLTPEQADKVVAYKDYFVRACLKDVVKRIEEEVKDESAKRKMFEELNKVFTKTLSTACEICTGLLSTMHGYPKLAEYVHSMFPHRKEKREEPPIKVSSDRVEEFRSPQKSLETSVSSANKEQSTPQKNHSSTSQKVKEPEKSLEESALCDDSTMLEAENTYEADESMSEEETNNSDNGSEYNSESENNNIADQIIVKEEHPLPEYDDQGDIHMTKTPRPMVIINKTEIQDFNECSNSSMKIVFEEEIKSETPEWKRDEDKLILEVLKEHLSPEERLDKTILEIIEEKDIVNMLSESLVDKSKDDIKTRLLYLLQLC